MDSSDVESDVEEAVLAQIHYRPSSTFKPAEKPKPPTPEARTAPTVAHAAESGRSTPSTDDPDSGGGSADEDDDSRYASSARNAPAQSRSVVVADSDDEADDASSTTRRRTNTTSDRAGGGEPPAERPRVDTPSSLAPSTSDDGADDGLTLHVIDTELLAQRDAEEFDGPAHDFGYLDSARLKGKSRYWLPDPTEPMPVSDDLHLPCLRCNRAHKEACRLIRCDACLATNSHTTPNCPLSQSPCYKCGSPAHPSTSSDCPLGKKEKGELCSDCPAPALHLATECPRIWRAYVLVDEDSRSSSTSRSSSPFPLTCPSCGGSHGLNECPTSRPVRAGLLSPFTNVDMHSRACRLPARGEVEHPIRVPTMPDLNRDDYRVEAARPHFEPIKDLRRNGSNGNNYQRSYPPPTDKNAKLETPWRHKDRNDSRGPTSGGGGGGGGKLGFANGPHTYNSRQGQSSGGSSSAHAAAHAARGNGSSGGGNAHGRDRDRSYDNRDRDRGYNNRDRDGRDYNTRSNNNGGSGSNSYNSNRDRDRPRDYGSSSSSGTHSQANRPGSSNWNRLQGRSGFGTLNTSSSSSSGGSSTLPSRPPPTPFNRGGGRNANNSSNGGGYNNNGNFPRGGGSGNKGGSQPRYQGGYSHR
ncbi:hypothetical protein H9P43_000589 [Blastocladiella emersonii ATCC 22665]|nr:hypothetical protein H9P43_000589 [Blastocladiella emersonii ATCC 22665]